MVDAILRLIFSGLTYISLSFTQSSVVKAPFLVPNPGGLIIVPKTLSPTENFETLLPISKITPEKSLPTPLGNNDFFDSNHLLGHFNFIKKDNILSCLIPSKIL